MEDHHLLQLNPLKVIKCLTPILSAEELNKIKIVLHDNVEQLLSLGRSHLHFALSVSGSASWRQRVSRGYYCAYCASRAVRLAHDGFYKEDSGDHKRIKELPSDFPSKSTWVDFLVKFKADRNLADYDHTVLESALELPSSEYLEKSKEFLDVVGKYLKEKEAF